jgi:hypothetical protein
MALAPAEHLAASGKLPQSGAVITFRINPHKVPAGAVPFLASLDPATGSWTPVPSSYNRRTGKISAHVTHFSIWAPLAWLTSRLFAVFKGALLSLFSLGGDGSAPSCRPPTLPVIDSKPNEGVGACAQAAGPASVLVKIVDERPYPFDLLYPPGAHVSPPVTDPAALLGAEMSNIASRWHTRMLLSGGSEADLTIALPVGHDQALDTEFDGEAWTLGLIGTAINLLIETTPVGGGVSTAKKLIDALGKAHCFAEVVNNAQTVSLSLATAQNLGSTAFDCLAAVAKGLGGEVLAVSSIFASLATGVIGGVWADVDVVFGDASHALSVERPAARVPSAPCTSTALASAIKATANPQKLPENWTVRSYSCRDGQASVEIIGLGYPTEVILKQQGPSWMVIKIEGESGPATFAVTSSSPTSGPASGGTLIVIHGSGFSSVTNVVMNSIEPPLPEGNPNYYLQNLHPRFSVVSDSEIDVTTTAGAAGFTYEIDFITPTDEYFRNTFPGIPLFTYN